MSSNNLSVYTSVCIYHRGGKPMDPTHDLTGSSPPALPPRCMRGRTLILADQSQASWGQIQHVGSAWLEGGRKWLSVLQFHLPRLGEWQHRELLAWSLFPHCALCPELCTVEAGGALPGSGGGGPSCTPTWTLHPPTCSAHSCALPLAQTLQPLPAPSLTPAGHFLAAPSCTLNTLFLGS